MSGTLGGRYLNDHRSQYQAGATITTRHSGCTWTAVANGADASSGGRVKRTPDQIHALVLPSEETNAATPGWSMHDAALAAGRAGTPLENRSGRGWAAVVAAWDAGLYVVLQGDSDQFGNGTCSGDFDGTHAIGVHPAFRLVDGLRQRWIDDSICPTGRWEFEYVLRRYAVKFATAISFGVFTTPVPKVAAAPAPAVTLIAGSTRYVRPFAKRISVPAGQRANVRRRPTTSAAIVVRLANGTLFTIYQRTRTGQPLAGSRTWYGDRTGTRWLHSSAF